MTSCSSLLGWQLPPPQSITLHLAVEAWLAEANASTTTLLQNSQKGINVALSPIKAKLRPDCLSSLMMRDIVSFKWKIYSRCESRVYYKVDHLADGWESFSLVIMASGWVTNISNSELYVVHRRFSKEPHWRQPFCGDDAGARIRVGTWWRARSMSTSVACPHDELFLESN